MKKIGKLGVLFFMFIVLSVSSSYVFSEEQLKVKVLVIPSRNYASMQPQIYHAFKDTEKKVDPSLKLKFVLFNTFLLELSEEGPRYEEELNKFMNLANECVPEVVSIKKANPKTGTLLKNIHDYIKENPESYLAKLHQETERLMKDFGFLIIESSDTYGVHPMFYVPFVTEVNTPDGAVKEDIIEALYGFFFIDAAFKQDKPVWGTCHGAQVGYVHAGGKLVRLYEYKEGGYDIDFKRKNQISGEIENWHIGKWLYTHKKDTPYREYGLIICPVPEIYKDKEEHNKKMYINKDFEHSLAMAAPVLDKIKVISYHPLSEYKERNVDKDFKEFNKDFSKAIKNQIIIDAYKYNTMLGTQYHPQFTHEDLHTSAVFEYLVRQIIDKNKE